MRSVAEEHFDDAGCILLSCVVRVCVSKQASKQARALDTDVDLNAGQAELQEECLSCPPEKSFYRSVGRLGGGGGGTDKHNG